MSELARLREAFDSTPEPKPSSVTTGRLALLHEVERRRNHQSRLWSVPSALAAVVVGVVIVVLALPRGSALTGVEIAAAADHALAPQSNGIWHIVEEVRDGAGAGYRIETWATTRQPYLIRTKTATEGLAPSEEADSTCGSVYSTQGTITLSVRPLPVAARIEHPTKNFRRAIHDKHTRYQGDVTVNGVRAYKLVETTPVHGSATYRVSGIVTTLIRHGNYYPLESSAVYTRRFLEKGKWRTTIEKEIVTYPTFELLPRNVRTARLLKIAQPRRFFVIPDQTPDGPARCVRTVQSLLRHR